MKYPKIRKALFNETPDTAINSRVLRTIFWEFRVSPQSHGTGNAFPVLAYRPKVWGVCIEDQHNNEAAPHYILKVGDGNFEKDCQERAYIANYCDYHSILKDDLTGDTIHMAPGYYTIRIWMPYDEKENECFDMMADRIECAYRRAMIETLPDYAILTEKLIPLP